MTLNSLIALADKIERIREERAAFEEQAKTLKMKEDMLRDEMLGGLREERMKAFKSEAGYSYVRVFRASLAVVDEGKAIKWALKHDCAKVDTAKADRVLKGSGALPDGFEQRGTESLTIKSVSEKEEEI